MNTTSTLYNSIISGIHRFEVKVNIAVTDCGMDVLTSLNSCRSVFGSGSPRLGLAPAGELSLSLYLDSGSVPRMAEIRPVPGATPRKGGIPLSPPIVLPSTASAC